MELVDEAANDIVESRTQSAAGYYPDFCLCRFEEDLLPGSGFFKGDGLSAGFRMFNEAGDRGIIQHPVFLIYELIYRAVWCAVQFKRGDQVAFAQGGDDKVFVFHCHAVVAGFGIPGDSLRCTFKDSENSGCDGRGDSGIPLYTAWW